jgi:hypothetical protein
MVTADLSSAVWSDLAAPELAETSEVSEASEASKGSKARQVNQEGK